MAVNSLLEATSPERFQNLIQSNTDMIQESNRRAAITSAQQKQPQVPGIGMPQNYGQALAAQQMQDRSMQMDQMKKQEYIQEMQAISPVIKEALTNFRKTGDDESFQAYADYLSNFPDNPMVQKFGEELKQQKILGPDSLSFDGTWTPGLDKQWNNPQRDPQGLLTGIQPGEAVKIKATNGIITARDEGASEKKMPADVRKFETVMGFTAAQRGTPEYEEAYQKFKMAQSPVPAAVRQFEIITGMDASKRGTKEYNDAYDKYKQDTSVWAWRKNQITAGPTGTGILKDFGRGWFEVDAKGNRKYLSSQEVNERFAKTGADRKSYEKQIAQYDALQSFVSNLGANVSQIEQLMPRIMRSEDWGAIANMPMGEFRNRVMQLPEEHILRMLYQEISQEATKIASGAQQSIAAPSSEMVNSWNKIHDPNMSVGGIIEVANKTFELGQQRLATVGTTVGNVGKRITEKTPLGQTEPKSNKTPKGVLPLPPGAKKIMYQGKKAFSVEQKGQTVIYDANTGKKLYPR